MAAMVLDGGGGSGEGVSRSVKEAMKQAMLQQEGLFRNQVRELHRLYWTQRDLMQEVYRKPAAEAEERKELAEVPATAGVLQMQKTGVLEQWKGGTGELRMHKLRSFDLQLPADEYIWGNGEKLASLGGFVNSSSALSTELPTRKQISTACKPIHIDLNIPHDDELNGHIQAFPSPSTSSSVHHGSLWGGSNGYSKETSVTRQSDNTYPSSSISGENNADCLFHGCQDINPFSTQASAWSTKVTESCEHEHGSATKVCGPDLNVPAKCCTTTTAQFCCGLEGVENVSAYSSPTGLCKPEQNVDLLSGRQHSTLHSDSGRQASTITCNNANEYNNLHASVGSTSLPLTGIGDLDDKQPNGDGSEEDTVSSHAIARDKDRQDEIEIYTVVKKSTQTAGDSHCSAENQSAEKHKILPDSKDFETTKLDSLAAESFPSSVLQDTSCSTENLKPCSYKQQKTQAAEVDYVISQAAETIISFSMTNCACPPDRLASVECNETNDEPEYSSDSFESITLKLSDIRNDVCLMSTRSTEKEVGTDACRSKLRRGRGLKDFQKDVLPGIVSLSRHEIREDLHAIGCEVRKNGSRASHAEIWFVPVRSRRSRLYTTGRRH